jgi:serine/threonine-protein kinase
VGEHVLGARLGAGGSGVVYAAVHAASGSAAAVKVLGREMIGSPEAIERFAREARAANLIGHPNIVHVYGIGRLADGRPYLVMELLEGATLDRIVESSGRVASEEVLEIIEPVCAALAAAHAKGIVHRDLKPSNVMVAAGVQGRTIKLLDFGIAKLIDASSSGRLTRAGHRLGTPQTMAPEQIRGEDVDARADVYALGVLLFYLVTGRFPFQGPSQVELEHLHLEAPPPVASQFAPVSPALDAIVQRCLAKAPDARFARVDDVLEALQRALGRRASPSEPAPLRPAAAVYLEIQCRAADLKVAVAGGNALLGASILPDGDGRPAWLARLAELARRLHREGAAALAVDPRAHLNVCVHVDQAVVRGDEVTGGPITGISSWVPRAALDQAHATRAAADEMARTVGAAALPVLGDD